MVFPNKNNSKYFETVNDNKSIYIILGNLFKNFKIWGEGESFGIWIFTKEKISGEVISGTVISTFTVNKLYLFVILSLEKRN